jgi:hypothetical protein
LLVTLNDRAEIRLLPFDVTIFFREHLVWDFNWQVRLSLVKLRRKLLLIKLSWLLPLLELFLLMLMLRALLV